MASIMNTQQLSIDNFCSILDREHLKYFPHNLDKKISDYLKDYEMIFEDIFFLLDEQIIEDITCTN